MIENMGMLKLLKRDYCPRRSNQKMARGRSSYLELKQNLLGAQVGFTWSPSKIWLAMYRLWNQFWFVVRFRHDGFCLVVVL